ncbi:MAG: carboxypeptidase regulatory-like domain-containing protein, partial [Acidobacteriota bacterium]|nr:carboxypeptidase regulatory-like domain-containing protein [Acidobacteriota bacterium]
MRITLQLCLLSIIVLGMSLTGWAQAPVGDISGTVFDESGAVIPNIQVVVSNKENGQSRTATTGSDGTYSITAVPAGVYEVKVEAKGFRTLLRQATVAVGGTTTVEMHLQVGATKDVVTVEEVTPLVEYERHSIDGVVTRQQIQSLPLNGRSFLQLAMLEPGVTVSAGSQGQYNRAFDVSILGADSNLTRITVDGATVRDSVTGGTQQNFSQEVVQEFQVSSVNFDLSTSVGAGGAINVVTRSGGNEFHGSGLYFFRDHNMSAYPALQRSPLTNDPFFARRQSGFWVGGPVKKDKLFFFSSLEHNNQKGVFAPLPSDPLFRNFATIAGSPFIGTTLTERIDWRINQKHNAFVRYSHDGNHSFAPRGANDLPSAWVSNKNWADSGVFSLISSFTPSIVNEFRYSMTFWSNRNDLPSADQCPNCIGLGGPNINVDGTGLSFGNQTNSPQSRVLRRHIFADNLTWQKGTHRMKMGGEWEYQKGTGTYTIAEPAAITLFSPAEVALLAPQLSFLVPKTFNTLADILKLPLAGFAFSVGDVRQPPPFQIGNANHDNTFHFYWQDTYKVKPRFTLTYGLGWNYESNALNHDLSKPVFLAPIYGANNLGPEKHAYKHYSPSLGFAWSPFKDNKTVIRGGAGVYYDTIDIELRLIERAYLSPLGSGYLSLGGSSIPNPIPGIPGVPVGTPLSFRSPTAFPGSALVAILPLVRASVISQLHINPNNTDLSFRTIDLAKSATELFSNDFTPGHAQHASLGIQRQMGNDFAISADFVWRHFLHQQIRDVDLNHYNRYINGVQSPVIPICNGANGPECSTGSIGEIISGGRTTYKALLVKADKRFSRRYQLQVSYALQDQDGINGIYNNDNWFQYYGPQGSRHILNVSGVVDLPWKFQTSFISSFASKGPFQPVIPGVDLTGSGINGFPLPGMGTSLFNRGLDKSDLAKLVNQYNQTYAGKKGPNPGQTFPTITLPANYDFGRNFKSQDLRLTKFFRWRERYEL